MQYVGMSTERAAVVRECVLDLMQHLAAMGNDCADVAAVTGEALADFTVQQSGECRQVEVITEHMLRYAASQ